MSTRFQVKIQYKNAAGGSTGFVNTYTLSSGWNAAEVKAQFLKSHPQAKEVTILDHKAMN